MKLKSIIIALELLLVGGRDTGASQETTNYEGQRSKVTQLETSLIHRNGQNVGNTVEDSLNIIGRISTRIVRKTRRRRQKLPKIKLSTTDNEITSRKRVGLFNSTKNKKGKKIQKPMTGTIKNMGASRNTVSVHDEIIMDDTSSNSSENVTNNRSEMIVSSIENLHVKEADLSDSLNKIITMPNIFQTQFTTNGHIMLGLMDNLIPSNNTGRHLFTKKNIAQLQSKVFTSDINENLIFLRNTTDVGKTDLEQNVSPMNQKGPGQNQINTSIERKENITSEIETVSVSILNSEEEIATKSDTTKINACKFEEITTASNAELINTTTKTDNITNNDIIDAKSNPELETSMGSDTTETTTFSIDKDTTTIKGEIIITTTVSNIEEFSNLTRTDEQIIVALVELEQLRGQQFEMETDIEDKLQELEDLLEEEEINEIHSTNNDIEDSSERLQTFLLENKNKKEIPRKGKTINTGKLAELDLETLGLKVNTVTTTINVFDNLQGQLMKILKERKSFLDLLSERISSELYTIKQTLTFLRGIVNFKLDQTEILLGKVNPITDLLQSGSTSIFLLLTQFFEGVESVLAMKEQFLHVFASKSADLREANLLERVHELKLNTILPTTMRFLLNIHARSEKLGIMVKELYKIIGELVDVKKEVIGSIGGFIEQSMEFISGLAGPAFSLPVLISAVKSGNLYKLLNFGPVAQQGVPMIPGEQLEQMVEQLVRSSDLQSPLLNVPIKPLLVDNRLLGTLAGRNRERLVNQFLTHKLSKFLSKSQSQLTVNQGETLIKAWLPPLHLGSPCTNEMTLGRSYGSVVVNRNSRFTTLGGLRINSHAPASKDIIGTAWIDVDMEMSGSVKTSIGQQMFGRCFTKFISSSPLRVKGKARGKAQARVVVSNVHLETRKTRRNPLLEQLGLEGNLEEGVIRSHIVFTFNIKLEGSINHFDLSSLNLSGCKFQLLGIKMFSNCGLLERLIKKKIENASRNLFPISGNSILRSIERAIQMRVGDEVAIPLSLANRNNLGPVDEAVSITEELLNFNLDLRDRLASLTQDMEEVGQFLG